MSLLETSVGVGVGIVMQPVGSKIAEMMRPELSKHHAYSTDANMIAGIYEQSVSSPSQIVAKPFILSI